MSTIVITMAGESRRFRDAGFTEPKYRLVVNGHSLFTWSLSSVSAFVQDGWDIILIARATDTELDSFVASEFAALGWREPRTVLLDQPTDGQATTALQAAPLLDSTEPVVVFNIDTHVTPGMMTPDVMTGDGWVPCFDAAGESWSFVATDEHGAVTEVREKVRISDHATVGLYGFSQFRLFQQAYEQAQHAVGTAEASERYIAPLYNNLIADGRPVRNFCLPEGSVVQLGTPEDVAAFDERNEFAPRP